MAGERQAPPPGDVPPTPQEARQVFGARLDIAVRYVELLADSGITHGLIGPREAPRLWSRHVLNSAVAHPVFDPGATVADIGSGAGLPGIPLAIARPDLNVTLVEPLLRRTVWLTDALADLAGLGLDNVTVLRARAQDVVGDPHGPRFGQVTARAVARTAALARMTVGLLEPSGSIHALKGATATQELDEDSAALRSLGIVDSQVRSFGQGVVDPPTVVVSLLLGRLVGPEGAGDRRKAKSAPAGRARPRRTHDDPAA